MTVQNTEYFALSNHVDNCAVCSVADRRANDFCSIGRWLFLEWARTQGPPTIKEVILTDEQFKRLVAETERRAKKAEEN